MQAFRLVSFSQADWIGRMLTNILKSVPTIYASLCYLCPERWLIKVDIIIFLK